MCTASVIYNVFTPLPDSWYNLERISLFRRMITDAETFDRESGQPDCTDPEKAKLLDRINELEEQLKDK